MARALAARPYLLLLDEVLAGLNPIEILMVDELSLGLAPFLVLNIFEILQKLKSEGLTMFLVEQNVQMALAISDYAYVLSEGRIEIEGPASEVRQIPQVREAYFGI